MKIRPPILALFLIFVFASAVQASNAAPEVIEDTALPVVHVPLAIFWAVICTSFAFGLGFGIVYTLCWRRQMSIDKFGSDFGEVTVGGSRSSFQRSQEYKRPELCPMCPWMANLRV